MISKGRIVQHVETIEAYTCDKCGLVARPEDHIEYQEFTIIRVCGGYGSVFGDGANLQCELCQKCLDELVGKYFHES